MALPVCPGGWPRWPGVTVGIGAGAALAATGGHFTPLQAVAPPRIVAAAEAFGANYGAENLLKPPASSGRRAEYASRALGARTFVDVDFGRPVHLAAFRHVQRRTADTVAEAKLLFSDAADFNPLLATVPIRHGRKHPRGKPGAFDRTTMSVFSSSFVGAGLPRENSTNRGVKPLLLQSKPERTPGYRTPCE